MPRTGLLSGLHQQVAVSRLKTQRWNLSPPTNQAGNRCGPASQADGAARV